MGAKRDPTNCGRDIDAAQGSGEGLLLDVRVKQRTSCQDTTIGRYDLPFVGIMRPSGVGMAHRYVEPV